MAVLLSYHRLIEKDRRHVSYCWKVSILAVLVVAVASSLVISFSFYSLWESYSLNCFMGANLRFMVYGLGDDSEATSKLKKERQFWFKPLKTNALDERYTINEYSSKWSNPDFCEYLAYTPLFHALIGIIWAALFVIHGHGGEGIGNIIVRPWRIVIPSLAFFIICAISAIVCASFFSSGFKKFCQQFDAVNGTADCGRMITYFSMRESFSNYLMFPDRNYYLLTVFPWIWATSYILGALIFILRIALVVDFELVRIVISTIDQDLESDGSGQAEVINETTQVTVEDIEGI